MKFIDKVFIAYDKTECKLWLVKMNINEIITQKRILTEYELTWLYEILKQMKGEN